MQTIKRIACAAMLASGPAHALCSGDLAASDVDAAVKALTPYPASLDAAAKRAKSDGMWLQVMAREGVVEQVGQLQVLKMLVGLRDSVTGRENQWKVREAVRAVMHTTGDNAEALRGLVADGQRGAKDAGVAEELGKLGRDVQLVIAMLACEEKKETPASGR